MTDQTAQPELTFEEAMSRLEEIVQELDRGDLALEQALELFQEGSRLKELCERKLAEAEATVEQLVAGATESAGEAAGPSTLFE